MASKGYGNLWIMAIGLIVIFVIATVIVPELNSHGKTKSSDDWNTDMTSGEAVYYAPTTTLSGSGLKVNQAVDFSVYASPVDDTTGDGGVYAWIFQLDGANDQKDVANLFYGNGANSVAWYSGSNGAIIGVGPRFVQGPGAAAMDVKQTDLSLSIVKASSYTMKIWIASSTISNASDTNPSNYTSVSPMVKITIAMAQTEEQINAQVTMNQVMSVPSDNLTRGEWNTFSTMVTATGTGGWSDPVSIYIAIEKKGIRTSDVSIRMSGSSSPPTFTDEGDSLVALITTASPLSGGSDPESTTWTVTFELSFATTGTYTLTSWAQDKSTGSDLTTVTYDTLTVQTAAVIPEPTSNDTNATSGGQTDTTVPDQTTDSTPVEPVVATNSTNRSSE